MLHNKILDEINKNHQKNSGKNLEKITNLFIKKITNSFDSFSYNIAIANIHEMHSSLSREIKLEYKKDLILENYKRIITCLMPVVPHFSSEVLKTLNIQTKVAWPKYDDNLLTENTIPFVIQINGKKRLILEDDRDTEENKILKKVMLNSVILKYLKDKEIKKTIFVKNRLLNIII